MVKFLFGMAEDEKVEIVNVPYGSTVVKLRLRCDEFARVFVKRANGLSVHYVECNEDANLEPYYTIGLIHGANIK